MDRRFKVFANILFETGTFARPFLIYLREKELKNPKNDSEKAWRFFFDGLKNEQDMEIEKALKNYEHSFKYARFNSLRYLLMARKLSVYLKTGRANDGHKIYNYLRNNFSRIPSEIRYGTIVSTLVAYCAIYESYQNCIGKLKVDKMPSNVRAFIALSTGREMIKSKNIRMGIQKFINSFRLSEKSFHPAGMIMSMNGISWYMRDLHPLLSIRLGEKAVYFAGKYSDLNKYFFSIDTLFTVKFTQQREEIFPIARLINSFSYSLTSNQSKHFKLALEEARKLFELSRIDSSYYQNTTKLRSFIKKRICNISFVSSETGIDRKTISKIISGKADKIQGETLRKFVRGLGIVPDIISSPKPIIVEWLKTKRFEVFQIELKKLKSLKKRERYIKVFSAYSSAVQRRKTFSSISRKGQMEDFFEVLDDDEKTTYLINKKPELQEFLYFIGSRTPYEISRAELVETFIEGIPLKKQHFFMKLYFDSCEENREILDRFMRNYVRYNREWGIRLENEEYAFLAKRNKLKVQPFLVSIYCFERKKDRRAVKNFFGKL